MRGSDPSYPSRDGTLEPLDVVGLPPPFHHLDATPIASTLSLCDTPFLDETPTTATASLPTPGRPPPTDFLHFFGQSDQSSFACTIYPAEWHRSLQPPPAPKLQDMDSFTEGTAVGSFDFSLRSSCSSEHLSDRPYNDPPAREIEMWRAEVLLSTSSSPPSKTDYDALLDSDITNGCLDADLSTSWHATPTRAPKRQLSSTSVDGNRERGRKLSRYGRDEALTGGFCNDSFRRSLNRSDPSVDRVARRSPRSSSAPTPS